MISASNAIIKLASALYCVEGKRTAQEFADLPPEKQKPWIKDAEIASAIIGEACAHFCDLSDPDKPTEYLHRREHLADEMRARFVWPNTRGFGPALHLPKEIT